MRDQAEALEDKIRIQIESSRVRLHEFFIDYDRLRSGFVTRTQFGRILDQLLKSGLKDDEVAVLARKYDSKRDGKVDYRQFVQAINKVISTKDLSHDPYDDLFKNPPFLGTRRTLNQLEHEDEEALRALLARLSAHYAKKNFEALTFFKDFDKMKSGHVTESQFRRSLNEPPLSPGEMSLLVRKYQLPDGQTGTLLVNYINLYNDLCSYNEAKAPPAEAPSGVNPHDKSGLSIQEIIDKISICCYKDAIRIIDLFRDYDKLRSGLITDRQLFTGLSFGLQKPANLSAEEIGQLVEYFRSEQAPDKCNYRQLVETVENAFTIPDMEKKPLANVIRPPRGLLSKTLNGNLTTEENQVVEQCLEVIAEKVRKGNMILFPCFKDFDRSTAFTRNVTKLQFGRVLSTLKLLPPTYEFELLCRRFEDPVTGDVNYPVFCQAVEEDYVSSHIEDLNGGDEKKNAAGGREPTAKPLLSLNELLARIREHVLANRLRVKEFFQDMDPLNSGIISGPQFVRCLSSLGISSLGALNVSPAQLRVLLDAYKQPQRNSDSDERVNWKRFENDLESVFTLRELEKNPNVSVPASEQFLLSAPGTASLDEEASQRVANVMEALKRQVGQRRIDCWPPFKDYDKLNSGHTTRKQFTQCLAILGLNASDSEVRELEVAYSDNIGFNYYRFLGELQPNPRDSLKYGQLKAELDRLNKIKPKHEYEPLKEVQAIINKLKDKVFKNRVSIYEWLRDFDKLNSGRLPKPTFYRAFNQTNLNMTESELEILADYYSFTQDDSQVEYKQLCRDVENAFANLEYEKNPLARAEQHKPHALVDSNELKPYEEDVVNKALHKLSQRVRIERINLFPLFEDFDRVKNGNVTYSQFRRVLNDMKLAAMFSDQELTCISDKFSILIGSRRDVNYISFADRVNRLAQFEYRTP